MKKCYVLYIRMYFQMKSYVYKFFSYGTALSKKVGSTKWLIDSKFAFEVKIERMYCLEAWRTLQSKFEKWKIGWLAKKRGA